MAFPSNPANGQIYTTGTFKYQYDADKGAWTFANTIYNFQFSTNDSDSVVDLAGDETALGQ